MDKTRQTASELDCQILLCRARHVSDMDNKQAKDLAIIAPWHAACSMIEELAWLFDQYMDMVASYDLAARRRRKHKRLFRATVVPGAEVTSWPE